MRESDAFQNRPVSMNPKNNLLEIEEHMYILAELEGVNPKEVFRNTICLSSDVNAAYDPTFASVYDPLNSSYVNKGCVLTKYTGARGKSGSNDASAELMAKVIGIMEKEGVYWQIGELGAVEGYRYGDPAGRGDRLPWK